MQINEKRSLQLAPFTPQNPYPKSSVENQSEIPATALQFSQEQNLQRLYSQKLIDKQGVAKENPYFKFSEISQESSKRLYFILQHPILPKPKDLNQIPERKRMKMIEVFNETKNLFSPFPFFWDQEKNLMGLAVYFAQKAQFSLNTLSNYLKKRRVFEQQELIGSGAPCILGPCYYVGEINPMFKGGGCLRAEDIRSQFTPVDDYDFWMTGQKQGFTTDRVENEILNFLLERIPHTEKTRDDIKFLIRETLFKSLYSLTSSQDDQKLFVSFSNSKGPDYDLIFSNSHARPFTYSNGIQIPIPFDFNCNSRIIPYVNKDINACQCLFDKITGVLNEYPHRSDYELGLRKGWVLSSWTKGSRLFSKRLMDNCSSTQSMTKFSKEDPKLQEKIFVKMMEAINHLVLMQQKGCFDEEFWKSFCKELKLFKTDSTEGFALLNPLFQKFSDPLKGIHYLYLASLYAMPTSSFTIGYVLNGDLEEMSGCLGLQISYKSTTRMLYFFKPALQAAPPLSEEESLAVEEWLLNLMGMAFSKDSHFFDPFIKSDIPAGSFLSIAKASETTLFQKPLSYESFLKTKPLMTMLTSSTDMAFFFISRINAMLSSKGCQTFFLTENALRNRDQPAHIALAFIADLQREASQTLIGALPPLIDELKAHFLRPDFEFVMNSWINSSPANLQIHLLKNAAEAGISSNNTLQKLLKSTHNIYERQILLPLVKKELMNFESMASDMKSLISETFVEIIKLDVRDHTRVLSQCLKLEIPLQNSPILEKMIEQIIVDSIVQNDTESLEVMNLINESSSIALNGHLTKVKNILLEGPLGSCLESEKFLIERFKGLIAEKKIEQMQKELEGYKHPSTSFKQEIALLLFESECTSVNLDSNFSSIENFLNTANLDKFQKIRALEAITVFLKRCSKHDDKLPYIRKILFHKDFFTERPKICLEIIECLIDCLKWSLALEILQKEAKSCLNRTKLTALTLSLKSKAPEGISDKLALFVYQTVPAVLLQKNDLVNLVLYLSHLCEGFEGHTLLSKLIRAFAFEHTEKEKYVVKKDVATIIKTVIPLAIITPITDQELILGFNNLLSWLLKEKLFNEFLLTFNYLSSGLAVMGREHVELFDQFLDCQSDEQVFVHAPLLRSLFSKHGIFKNYFYNKDKEILFQKALLCPTEEGFLLLMEIFKENSFGLWKNAEVFLKTASQDLGKLFVSFFIDHLKQVDQSNKDSFFTLLPYFKKLIAEHNLSLPNDFIEEGFRISDEFSNASIKKSFLQIFCTMACHRKENYKLFLYFLFRLQGPLDDKEMEKKDLLALQLITFDCDHEYLDIAFDILIHHASQKVLSKTVINKAYQLITKAKEDHLLQEKAKIIANQLKLKGSLTLERCCTVLNVCSRVFIKEKDSQNMYFWLATLLDFLKNQKMPLKFDPQILTQFARYFSSKEMHSIFYHESIAMIASKATIQRAHSEFLSAHFNEAIKKDDLSLIKKALELYETHFYKLCIGSDEERALTTGALYLYRTLIGMEHNSELFSSGIYKLAHSIIASLGPRFSNFKECAIDILLWNSDVKIKIKHKIIETHRNMPELKSWQNRLFEMAGEALSIFLTVTTPDSRTKAIVLKLCRSIISHLIQGNKRGQGLISYFDHLLFSPMSYESFPLYFEHLGGCRIIYDLCVKQGYYDNRPDLLYKATLVFSHKEWMNNSFEEDQRIQIIENFIDWYINSKKPFVINELIRIMEATSLFTFGRNDDAREKAHLRILEAVFEHPDETAIVFTADLSELKANLRACQTTELSQKIGKTRKVPLVRIFLDCIFPLDRQQISFHENDACKRGQSLLTEFSSRALALAMSDFDPTKDVKTHDYAFILLYFWENCFKHNIFESEKCYIEILGVSFFSSGVMKSILTVNAVDRENFFNKYCKLLLVSLKDQDSVSFRLELFQIFVKFLLKSEELSIRLLGKQFYREGLLKGVNKKLSDDPEMKDLLNNIDR